MAIWLLNLKCSKLASAFCCLRLHGHTVYDYVIHASTIRRIGFVWVCCTRTTHVSWTWTSQTSRRSTMTTFFAVFGECVRVPQFGISFLRSFLSSTPKQYYDVRPNDSVACWTGALSAVAIASLRHSSSRVVAVFQVIQLPCINGLVLPFGHSWSNQRHGDTLTSNKSTAPLCARTDLNNNSNLEFSFCADRVCGGSGCRQKEECRIKWTKCVWHENWTKWWWHQSARLCHGSTILPLSVGTMCPRNGGEGGRRCMNGNSNLVIIFFG